MYALALRFFQTGLPLWLRWTLLNVVAYALVLLLLFVFLGTQMNSLPPALFGLCFGALFGTASGLAQACLLKNVLAGPWWVWALSTEFAWAVFFLIDFCGFLPQSIGAGGKLAEGLWHGALFGAMLGGSQALSFRYGRNAVCWFMGNVAIWSICVAAADAFKSYGHLSGPAEFAVALPLSALLTGLALQRLHNRLLFHP